MKAAAMLCAFTLFLPAVLASDPAILSSLFVQEATVNGDPLVSQSIDVQAGQRIVGSASLVHRNAWMQNMSVPLGVTSSWGSPQLGMRCLGEVKGNGTERVVFRYRAPQTPGTYHIIFAFRAEMNCRDVFSMTNWANSERAIWRDGNDIASWDKERIAAANIYGRTIGMLRINGNTTAVPVPSAAIEVRVH